MQEQTGDTYLSSSYAKALFAADAKVGKSAFLVASALGVLPWQKYGGVVDDPANLHVLTFDANALGHIKRFLTETCGAPKEALNFKVYNLQEDMRRVSTSQSDWDFSFFNAIQGAIRKVADRAKGVSVLHVSSLTGLAQGCERAMAGPPGGDSGDKRGAGMDQSKWAAFSHQMAELRNLCQQDLWHCFWEAHIYKPPATGQTKGEDDRKESLQISGKTGQNFSYNVEQVFRIRRVPGDVWEGTSCDKVYLDTRPAMDFIAGGRGFTEALNPKEQDLTLAFHKLGLKIGRWGAKPSKKVASSK